MNGHNQAVIGILGQAALDGGARHAPGASGTGTAREEFSFLLDGEAEEHALQIVAFLESITFKIRVHTLLYPTEPFSPNVIKQQSSLDVPQAIFGNFPAPALCEQTTHVHAGDAMAFR